MTNLRLEIVESFRVSRECFFPVPKVDSKVIVFRPKRKIEYKISKIENLEKITQLFFSKKRKMINKVFIKLFPKYNEISKKLNLNLSSRPSELSYENYYRITELYEKYNKV